MARRLNIRGLAARSASLALGGTASSAAQGSPAPLGPHCNSRDEASLLKDSVWWVFPADRESTPRRVWRTSGHARASVSSATVGGGWRRAARSTAYALHTPNVEEGAAASVSVAGSPGAQSTPAISSGVPARRSTIATKRPTAAAIATQTYAGHRSISDDIGRAYRKSLPRAEREANRRAGTPTATT